jgi:primosomal protein N' (replication factor Y)
VQAVVSGEPNRFYDEELAARRLLSYPPAGHLASLSVSGREPRVVETAAKEWRRTLEQLPERQDAVMVLGPVPTTGGRPNGHHRYQILVKGSDRTLLCRLVRHSIQNMEHAHRQGGIKFVVDMDPVEMT